MNKNPVSSQSTILVTDDDPSVLKLIRMALSNEGYRVLTADNGQEALQLLKTERPQLIILDINMPHMGGISFYHEIANPQDGTSKIPILVLTGRGELEEIFRGFQVDGFLKKPFELLDLVLMVKEILRKHEASRTAEETLQSDPTALVAGNLDLSALRQKGILIVEDDENTYEGLSQLFSEEGFRISRESNVHNLLASFSSKQPGLVLMKMGSLNLLGPEVVMASKLRKSHQNVKVPVLMYVSRSCGLNAGRASEICSKSDIAGLVQYSVLSDVVSEVNRIVTLAGQLKDEAS